MTGGGQQRASALGKLRVTPPVGEAYLSAASIRSEDVAHRFALTSSPIVRCALELDLSQHRHAPALRGIKQRLKQKEKFLRLREAFSANRGLIKSMYGQS
jgi:hypothetical protein